MTGASPHRPEVHRPTRVRRRTHERAFTLIELVIGMVIVGMLVGSVVTVMTTSRSSSGRAAAIATARTLGDAIDDFRKDHGGRPPVLNNARDWPAPVIDGPRHSFSDQRYLRRGAPDALRNGAAMIVGPTGSATGGARWALQYAPSTVGAGGWTITVRDRDRRAPACSIGGGQVSRLPERAC